MKHIFSFTNINPNETDRFNLLAGSLGTLALRICGLGLQMVIVILLARVLGSAGYGTYTYSLALINLMTIPTVMGLPNLVVRDVAIFYAEKQFGLMRGLLIRANQVVVGFSLAMGLAAAAIAFYYADSFSPTGLNTFLISLILLPLLALRHLRMATLRGLGYVSLGIMPEMLIRPVILILIVLSATCFMPSHLSSESAMAVEVTATAVAFFSGAWMLLRFLPLEAKTATPICDTKVWLKSATPFMLVGAMQIINGQTDVVMLGILRSTHEVGIYRVVFQGAVLVAFVLTAVNLILSPKIAALYARRDMKSIQRLVTLSARGIFAGSLPIVLIMIFGGGWVLEGFFGAEYVVGLDALRVLCVGQLTNACAGSVGVILNMTGHERYTVRGVGIAAAMNILLNFVLIPKFGLNGAAVATTVSLAMKNMLMFWWVYKKTGIISAGFWVNPS